MPRMNWVTAPAKDLAGFLGKLFFGKPFRYRIQLIEEVDTQSNDLSKEQWLCYYGSALGYITSLHKQFVAVLSIQGAIAIGCLAAIEAFSAPSGHPDPISRENLHAIGLSGSIAELILSLIVIKLFRQHCVLCWMLAQIEREKINLPAWAAMKTLLGSAGNRLFTSPIVFVFIVLYALLLTIGLGLSGFHGA